MKKELLEQIGSQLTMEQSFVHTSFPSVFSKEDVIKLLDSYTESIFAIVAGIEEKPEASTELSAEKRIELEHLMYQAMERRLRRLNDDEVVDYDSAEFTIEYGNNLRLESVSVNSARIADELQEVIEEVVGDFFSPIEEEVKEEVAN